MTDTIPTKLTDHQMEAADAVLKGLKRKQRVMVLTGPAGSGKTTLMRALIPMVEEHGYDCVLVAPTGKAAVRLTQLTGRPATTIHSPLYQKKHETSDGDLEFARPQAVGGATALVICDEASMLGSQVFGDLIDHLPNGACLLCVGDREQLPPVKDTWGPDFVNPTAHLDEVHRQALESPILELATGIREGFDWRLYDAGEERTDYLRVPVMGLEEAVNWYVGCRTAKVDAVLLTYLNNTRIELNRLIRERLGRTTMLEVGDRLVCVRNNRQDLQYIANGTLKEVAGIVDFGMSDIRDVTFTDGTNACVSTYNLGVHGGGGTPLLRQYRNSLHDRLMLAEYGECLTVHKSQGSQWDAVGIFHDFGWTATREQEDMTGKEFYRRLMYTAVTRAAKELVIFDAK